MDAILYEKKGSVAHITINRPEAMNALNAEVWQGLKEAFGQVKADPAVRVAILSGAGDRAFSVGADLKAGPPQPSTPEPVWPFDLMCSADMQAPVIGAINGYCLGAGFFLALACDIRVATDDAAFGIPEVRLGISPTMGVTQWLPRMIPPSVALKLLLTGERFSAAEACRLGLVNEVVAKNELTPAVERLADQISNNGPLAVRGVKTAVWAGLRHGMDEGLRVEREAWMRTRESKDRQEARRAFAEKRTPVFRGE